MRIPTIRKQKVLPKYQEGKNILVHDYDNDLFTGAKLFGGLDIVVTGANRKPKSRSPRTSMYSKNYQAWDTQDLLGAMISGSDPGDVIDVLKNVYNKNYTNATIGAGLLALPNVAEKPLRYAEDISAELIKRAKEVEYARKFYIRLQDAARGFIKGGEQVMPSSAMVPIDETGLSIRNISPVGYENPVTNPAELAAALDFLRDLRSSGTYKQFFSENPDIIIEKSIRPGVSEDWAYPYDVMVKHKLRKPVVSTNAYTAKKVEVPKMQVETPKKTALLRSRDYNIEKNEDRNQGVYKRLRLAFNKVKALSDGDMRHLNAGRPRMTQIRLASENIERYSLSKQREYNKLLIKLAKKGYLLEDMVNDPAMKEFLRTLIEAEGHRW